MNEYTRESDFMSWNLSVSRVSLKIYFWFYDISNPADSKLKFQDGWRYFFTLQGLLLNKFLRSYFPIYLKFHQND